MARLVENSFEECEPTLLVEGDVVTHLRVNGGQYPWNEVKTSGGNPCGGWEIVGVDDDDFVTGYTLWPANEDTVNLGHQPYTRMGSLRRLLAVEMDVTCRVRPFDREPETDSSHWNGTCPHCGRYTYTSAFSVEHQGGDCK